MTFDNDEIWSDIVTGGTVDPAAEDQLLRQTVLDPKLGARLYADRWIDRALAAMPRIDADAEKFHNRVVAALAIDDDEQVFVDGVSGRIDREDNQRKFRRSQKRATLGALALGCASACALVIFATVGVPRDQPNATRPGPSAPVATAKIERPASPSMLTVKAPFDLWRANAWVSMPSGATMEAVTNSGFHLRSQDKPLSLSPQGGPQIHLNARAEVELTSKGGQESPLAVNVISGAVYVDTAGSQREVSVRLGGETIKPLGPARAAFVADRGRGLSIAVLHGAVATQKDKPVVFGSGIAAILDGDNAPKTRSLYRASDFGWTPVGQERRETLLNFDFEDGRTPPYWNATPVTRCPPHAGQNSQFCVSGAHYDVAPWIVGLEMKNMAQGLFTIEAGMNVAFDYWTGQPGGDRGQVVEIWLESDPGVAFHYDLRGAASARWTRAEIPFADFLPRRADQPVKGLRPGDRIRFLSIMVLWKAEDVLFIDNVEISRRASPTGI